MHRQLDTEHKLFCDCPTVLSTRPPTVIFERRLRPTQSELGQIDPAALFEFHKGKTISYEADHETTCLVELDEEPPHRLNPEGVDIALTMSMLLHAKPLDEVHVMRKVVIDGSNTTGFQRTAVIALNGSITVEGVEVPIEQVTLEEDSGRKTGDTKTSVIFRLDRLGVPLIEVSTGPVIHDPEQAGRVAFAIGRILRATKKVKRGLGSIRQDLNVSIKNGALIEVKGVQELELVSKAVGYEVQRQLALLEIKDELRQRNVNASDIKEEFVDITDILSGSESKIVQSTLKQGGVALAVKLPSFKGLLKRELTPNVRLGTEMAKRAVFWGRVGGIFHSDELPAYGIDSSGVEAVAEKLGCGDLDGFVVVADSLENSKDGLRAVVERAREAVERVPEETRAANPDGTTVYLRPRPGAARMYPETDVPPVQIGEDRLEQLWENLPRMPEELAKELETKHSLSSKLATQLVDSDYLPLFEEIVAQAKGVAPSFVATVLTESLRSLQREQVPVENVREDQLKQAFDLVSKGATAKESVLDVLKWLAFHPDGIAEEAVDMLNLRMLTKLDLENIISKVVESNQTFVQENGSKALGRMMNLVMGEVRGRADPRQVTELLRSRLEQVRT
ncbi:Glu-tRNA(Gln) amidotransferase subunit GatE [Candidatus Bathyarchaeota archaeon]|nr:MAG: Glu-tRNA(Gln) amidotransferase subunit GatE [Candidatus Bathyarchaeota archaeon]